VSKVPWPLRLWARRRGGSSGSSCGIPFFPRVLVHLVGLHHSIVQRVAVEVESGTLLEAVPQGQQFLAIAAQLARHQRRGGALSDPAQDHQELRGTAMGPLQGGPREGVEDPAATAALEVHEGRAMAAVNPEVWPLSAARASQAVRMEQFDELGVAGVLVEIVEQGEVHGQNLRATRGMPVEDITARSDRQEAEHRIPLMSHEFYRPPSTNQKPGQGVISNASCPFVLTLLVRFSPTLLVRCAVLAELWR
jgi:hypothetical protein